MQNKLSLPNLVLRGLLAIAIVFTLIFFCGSTENYDCNGISFEAPSFTPAFIALAYVFVGIATVVTLAFAIMSFVSKLSYNPKSVFVPLISVAALALLLIITYCAADTQPMNITGYEGSQEPWVYKITNMCMVTSFILAGIACVVTLGSSLVKKF